MQDDLYYWHLTSSGWSPMTGGGGGEPPRSPETLVVSVFHSPNEMYSRAYWHDNVWVFPDEALVQRARGAHGRRPKSHY